MTDEEYQVVEQVANTIAPNFTFGYYEAEDIKQEIWIMCLEALPKFDKNRGASLKTFLLVHCKNRLISLKRNKTSRIVLPCLDKCPHWDDELQECSKYRKRSNCKDYSKWQSTINDKNKIFALMELDDTEAYYETDILEDIHKDELLSYIDENIPAKYRNNYLQFIEGGKLSTYSKNVIRDLVKRLAEDYLN